MQDRKEELLRLIESMGVFSYSDKYQRISHTDWHLSSRFERPYFNIVKNAVLEVINKGSPITNEELYINNIWFQQYEANDFQDWHVHGDSLYSSVYYVELPPNTKTSFREQDKEIQLDVEEGDYVVFPSCLRHTSKENKSGMRKTIISMNLNVY